MRVLMIGCEYAGKTTLANRITQWIKQTMGGGELTGWHDHFTLPFVGQHPDPRKSHRTEDVMIELLKTEPWVVEQFQRYQFVYHLQPILYQRDDLLLVNWYYGDAVYAPLYYPDIETEGHDRKWLARFIEGDAKALAPDMVLALVTAPPDVIRERMRQHPRAECFLQDQDVELVLDRFQEAYRESLINSKITVDTSDASVEETLRSFVQEIEPYLQPVDRQRILCHQALRQGGSIT